jgi:outer membrane protein OmpA-like peptidoglycan-associated protein
MSVAYKRGLSVSVGGSSVVKLPTVAYRARLTGLLFDSERAFLLPSAMNGIRALKSFYDSYPDLKVLVTGHTDTMGPASYNMNLSLDRAKAVAAYLREEVEVWMKFYKGTGASTAWGVREDQHMLHTLTYYSGPTHGQATAELAEAWKRFQTGSGLAATGTASEPARRALVTRYMALDGTTLPAGVEVAVHGCGKSHNAEPVGDQVDWPKNRRVEVFLFRGAIDPPPRASCDNCAEYAQWLAATVKTVDLDEPSGKLEVLVLDTKGQPCPGAKVTARGIVQRTAETGPDGKAIFGDVIPDVYRLTAEAEGFAPGEKQVVVLSGQSVETSLELEPQAGTATFKVLLADDKPAANMKVKIQKPDGTLVDLTTNGEGEVELEGKKGQVFTLISLSAGYAVERTEAGQAA